jgi:hypothetical protein
MNNDCVRLHRCTVIKDVVEERLFAHRRDLLSKHPVKAAG